MIEEPTGYGNPNKVLGTLHIDDVSVENTAYVPVVPILTEPSSFMAIVPADKALSVANAIKNKYEKEMGKVRNRLPLSVGIVYAGSRTPLPAILDAGRRMLKQPVEAEHWEVVTSTGKLHPEMVTLELKQNETTLIIEVPTIMGDGITEDVWYPYWCLEKGADNAGSREREFKGVDGKTWVHVKDLLSR